MWVEPEIRDSVVNQITYLSSRSGIPAKKLLPYIGLCRVKFYKWVRRSGTAKREHYSENDYFLKDGYRRVAYKMLNSNIVAVSLNLPYSP